MDLSAIKRSTIDLPLAPEFRDALTSHPLSCSPSQPIKFGSHAEAPPQFSDQFAPLCLYSRESRGVPVLQNPYRNILYLVANAPSKKRFMHMHILPYQPVLYYTNARPVLAIQQPWKPGGVQPVRKTLQLGAHRSRPG